MNQEQAMGRNRQAAGLSLALNGVLTTLKFVVAVLTGSVSLLSEAFHSGTDVLGSLVAYLAIRAAANPPSLRAREDGEPGRLWREPGAFGRRRGDPYSVRWEPA
jgi:Co/Zn/Cd efflux system component